MLASARPRVACSRDIARYHPVSHASRAPAISHDIARNRTISHGIARVACDTPPTPPPASRPTHGGPTPVGWATRRAFGWLAPRRRIGADPRLRVAALSGPHGRQPPWHPARPPAGPAASPARARRRESPASTVTSESLRSGRAPPRFPTAPVTPVTPAPASHWPG
jgi:hypothetical protein